MMKKMPVTRISMIQMGTSARLRHIAFVVAMLDMFVILRVVGGYLMYLR